MTIGAINFSRTIVLLAFSVASISAICPVLEAQLAIGGSPSMHLPPPRKKTPAPESPEAKPATVNEKRLAEAVNRMTPKQREKLAKALRHLTPERRRQLEEAMKGQLPVVAGR